jgi:hypothetical protein
VALLSIIPTWLFFKVPEKKDETETPLEETTLPPKTEVALE